MSVANMIFQRLFSLFCGILRIIRGIIGKAMCSVRRMRKNSGSLLPTTIDKMPHVPDVPQAVPSNDLELESWDSWGADGDGLGINSKTSQNYSRYSSHVLEPAEPEPEPDFFQDMQPEYRKPAKILIKKKDDLGHIGLSNRLTMSSDLPPTSGSELGSWDDGESAWAAEANEDLSWQAEETIKQKKRMERERRQMEQQMKKMEKEASRTRRDSDRAHLPAVKLS